jgi:hypothetical protein
VIPRVSAETRGEVLRLRGERLSYAEIAGMTRLDPKTVARVCENHFGNLVERAKVALRREINLARAEMHTAPLYHPETWS